MPRLISASIAIGIATFVFLLRNVLSAPVRGALGIICFIAIVAACSTNIRAVRWKTVLWGLVIQIGLALVILKVSIAGHRPGYELFEAIAAAVRRFLSFTDAGAEFVFGGLANQDTMSKVFTGGFVFAFMGLPVIIFVSSFFTVLHYLGILPFIVRVMARGMMRLMGTSGAETLSAAANVFMGQSEAPLIVKPYVARMTESELLAIMVGGLATISGGMMAIYIALGADPVAILTTSVMAAPAGLYLSKIMIPESGEPETRGYTKTTMDRTHVNVIDAAAAGAGDGLMLSLNVAAMLIAFLSLLAMADYLLGKLHTGWTLAYFFSHLMAPAAVLLGTPMSDVPALADLLGTKLVANEFVAYVKLTGEYRHIAPASYSLATYALTGFANLGSIGILIGALGAMAPTRRSDLARLGGRALLAGFLATMINASIVSLLL